MTLVYNITLLTTTFDRNCFGSHVRFYNQMSIIDIYLIVSHLRSFLQTVEVTMQQICLFELMGCTLTMCFFGYCLITVLVLIFLSFLSYLTWIISNTILIILKEWGNHNPTSICTYFVGLLSITSHIFMFCFVGEQLTLQVDILLSFIYVRMLTDIYL